MIAIDISYKLKGDDAFINYVLDSVLTCEAVARTRRTAKAQGEKTPCNRSRRRIRGVRATPKEEVLCARCSLLSFFHVLTSE